MNERLRHLLLGAGLAAAAGFAPPASAADSTAAPAAGTATPATRSAPPPQYVRLRVSVGANGRVLGGRSLDPATPVPLVQAASEIAGKLQFTPAMKGGQPVASETSLAMVLGMVPRPGGGYGLSLLRAQNGPSVVEAHMDTPKVSREEGGVVVVGVDLLAGGVVDMKSFRHEKTELRVPSSFAEQRFLESARKSLKDAKFMLDKVDGIEVPARVSVPFQFNGGLRAADLRGLEERDDYGTTGKRASPAPGGTVDTDAPWVSAVSSIEGISLPKIDYRAPEKN